MLPQRKQRIEEMQARRWKDVVVVLENVDDPHNLGAILRSCDAVGVGEVHLVYSKGKAPRLRELKTNSAASATKWLTLKHWSSMNECLVELRKRELKIVVTALSVHGRAQWECDFRVPCAIVVGNEHDGVSSELLEGADEIVTIPMRGMVQSLNVSVATAVILEEMLRQRLISI